MKILLFTLCLSFGLFTSAFGQIKAARSEMAEYNYSKAIEILHQFIQKADPKTKLEATLLMADCYRLQNDMQDARTWYFKAIKLGSTDALTYFYYGKALRACGEYETAKMIFLKYDSLKPEDQRGKIYASFCDSAMAWDERPFAYEVNNARNLNSTSSEFGPVFYNDGVIFASDRIMSTGEDKKSGWAGNGYLKLMFANPKQKDDYYGDYNLPRLAPEFFNNGTNDGPAAFNKEGDEVFITRATKATDKARDESDEPQSNQLKIYSATKTGDKWSKLKPFFFNNNQYSVGYPSLSPDGSSLYFVSDVDGGFGGTDLFVTSRASGSWSQPVNLGPIVNTFGNETFPFMAENGDLYFASDGHPGYGGLDIFVTRKIGNVWVIPQNLGKPINSSYDDFALAMYKNDSVGLFSANRPGGRGEDDIYSFRVVGPLPALTSQPAIASVQHPNPGQESRTPAINDHKVPPPSTGKTEVGGQKAEVKPVVKPEEKVVPVASPATAEVKKPSEEIKKEVKPEEKPITKPAEKVVPVPSPATAEVKKPTEEAKKEVKPEEKPVTKPTEKVVPIASPATAEVKKPSEEIKKEVKPEEKPVTMPAEKVVPVPTPATAEVKKPVEEPKKEVKPEEKKAEVKPIVKPEEKIISKEIAKPGPVITVAGCVKDGSTHDPIAAATVFFLDENKGRVIIHKAGATGCFRSELRAGVNYRVKAMQTGYSSDCLPFYADAATSYTEARISNDLLLEKTGVTHTYRVDNIYYDFDHYFIRPDAVPTLNKLVQIMVDNPVKVELASHADCRGTQAYNLILTEKRVASAADYIVQKGIDGSRLTKRWYGKSKLVNNCNCAEGTHCTEAEHQLNRRTEFEISLPAETISETPVNLEKFREGDTLDLRMLPAGFFKSCNHHTLGGPLADLLKSSTLLPDEIQNNVIYTVQIGAFSFLTPHFHNLNEVMSCKGNDGILRCFVGRFTSKEEATWFRDHLRSGEFKDAFVAEIDERHNPNDSAQQAYFSRK